MISPHVPGVGYTWIIVAHQKAAKIFSSLVTVGGLVTLYVLLCLFNSCLQQQQQQDDDPYIQQRNAITEYLQNHNQTVSVEQLAYCAFLLVAIPNHSNNSSNNQLDETSLRGAEQINAIFNLIVSFGLGMLLLMFISAMTLMCYPRSRHDYGMERWEERRASKRYRLLKIGLLLRKFHVVSYLSYRI
ncbi:expressed unknown protein [Seminavis robusta]|uniref:Uncharacterized protein n=1 Tax=Seminavis robusta TaxID=568900 RepID=A0A9N8EDQ2_9STRA|nr:expressed unknown protein [Seminavis robusta]|eukprot:Sro852_g211050.1 n/a (187) ;mRNA; f:35967-36527